MPRKTVPMSRPSARKGQERSAPRENLDTQENEEKLARQALRSICLDEKLPAAARAQAARTLLELSGALKNPSTPETKTPSELTLEELDTRIASLDTEDTQAHDGV